MRFLGRAVGDMFVKLFPGIGQMLNGLDELLSSESGITSFVGSLKSAFESFFIMLQTDPQKAIGNFIKNLEGVFKSNSGTDSLLQGFYKFRDALIGIFAGLIDFVAPKIVKSIETLTEIISDPDGIQAGFEKLKTDSKSMFAPIVDAIWRNVPILFDSLKKMFEKAWEQYGDTILSYVGKFLLINIGVGVIKGIAMALPAILSTLMKSLGEAILERLGAESFLKLAEKIFTQGPGKKIFSKFLNFAGIGALIGAALSASEIDSIVGDELIKKFESGEIKNKGTIAMSKVVMTLINALTFGFLSNETLNVMSSKISDFFDKFFDFIQDKFGTQTNRLVTNIADSLFSTFSGIGDIIIGVFTLDFSKIFDGMSKALKGLWLNLKSSFVDFPLALIENFTNFIIAGISEFLGSIVGTVSEELVKLGLTLLKGYNYFNEHSAGEMISSLTEFMSKAVAKLAIFIINLFGKLKPAFDEVAESIKRFTIDAMITGLSVFGQMGKSFYEGFTKTKSGKTFREDLESALGLDKKDSKEIAKKAEKVFDSKEISKSLSESLKKVKIETPQDLNSLGDEVLQYEKLTPEKIAKTKARLEKSMKNMSEITKNLDTSALQEMRTRLSTFDIGVVDELNTFFEKIRGLTEGMAVSEVSFKNLQDQEFLLNKIVGLADVVKTTSAVMSDFSTLYSYDLVSYVQQTVEDMNALNALLDDISVPNIDSVVDSLNNKLVVDNKQIQIQHKPINITLNMQVTFKAEEFVTDIFKVANNQIRKGKVEVQKLIRDFDEVSYDWTQDDAWKNGQ